eukprot:4096248-Prymnesium_polylepis.2
MHGTRDVHPGRGGGSGGGLGEYAMPAEAICEKMRIFSELLTQRAKQNQKSSKARNWNYS